MDYKAAMDHIARETLRPVYLLHGEESYLLRRVSGAILDRTLTPEEREMNLTVLDRDPALSQLIGLLETAPFFGEKNVVLIRQSQLTAAARKERGEDAAAGGDDTGKPQSAAGEERLLKLLANMPECSMLILMTAKADKRRKIYKTIEKYGMVVEAPPLKGKELRAWLTGRLAERKLKLAPDAAEYLLTAVSLMSQVSLDFIENELEKAALHQVGPGAVSLAALQQTLSAAPEISVFAMLEALSQKQLAEALGLLEAQLAAGEHPIKLLALLARQVRQLWQTRMLAGKGQGSREIAEYFRVPPFIGEKLLKQSRSFDGEKLKQALLELADADRDLKSGRASALALERIMIDLCRGC
ncbi:MAG TPA: DNA polymerase III subunit delta [Patescibacteria group bacterium]|nr:DNA polymerase III subunit delta [Patescibacteria group bacterium]